MDLRKRHPSHSTPEGGDKNGMDAEGGSDCGLSDCESRGALESRVGMRVPASFIAMIF